VGVFFFLKTHPYASVPGGTLDSYAGKLGQHGTSDRGMGGYRYGDGYAWREDHRSVARDIDGRSHGIGLEGRLRRGGHDTMGYGVMGLRGGGGSNERESGGGGLLVEPLGGLERDVWLAKDHRSVARDTDGRSRGIGLEGRLRGGDTTRRVVALRRDPCPLSRVDCAAQRNRG